MLVNMLIPSDKYLKNIPSYKIMDNRDKILEFIKARGPILPVQISKEIGTDILMASAHLAELTASKRLKISTIKVGGSPLYYLQGQESMLQKYTASMNDKEKKAFDLLSQSKILRDIEQEPVIRVALREIKDFAIPLNVTHNSNKEMFWKWYLINNEEAESLIKQKLQILEKPIEKKTDKQIETIQKQTIKEQKPIESVQKEIKQIKEKRKYKPREKEDNFLKEIMKFFEKNKINIINTEIIKKSSEIDFIVEIPSVMGNLQYYCKARNKKKISDSDLSNAYVKGQFKKLPVIVISPGELSSKAQEILAKELNNITFKKI